MRLIPRFWPRRWLPPKLWGRRLKKRLPRSLFGRTLMIVLLPAGVMQAAVAWASFHASGAAFLLWLIAATAALIGVAVLFLRNQARAIERLAVAAEAFGKGADLDFKPHGAAEVRRAGEAFVAMRRRIARHMEQRTALLASVSHDLRTPLTRLKLELAMGAGGERGAAMRGDVADMERMVDEYLLFARAAHEEEAPESTPVLGLLQAAARDAEAGGADVEAAAPTSLSAVVRPTAVRRLLSNLAVNAAAHGRRVRLAAVPRGRGVEITVDDDGPGIPPERREEAFRPFHRLDPARRNPKGAGLGLAIARDAARSHGGEVTLTDSPLGGLRAVVILP